MSNFSVVAHGVRRELQQASSPRLTPEERKRACGKRSLFLRGNERARPRPIRKSGRGASTLQGPQAGARTTHRGHTLTQDGRDRLTEQPQAFPSDAPPSTVARPTSKGESLEGRDAWSRSFMRIFLNHVAHEEVTTRHYVLHPVVEFGFLYET